MKRQVVVVLAAMLSVVGTVAVWRGTSGPSKTAQPKVENPGGYVASDVALLAATGRPQVVEVFHYG